jgi:hypothetical protein
VLICSASDAVDLMKFLLGGVTLFVVYREERTVEGNVGREISSTEERGVHWWQTNSCLQ